MALAKMFLEGLYQGYTYAYPHKLAYRELLAKPLRQVWADEDLSALFLYLHIPFCEIRCGFCNLLTVAKPRTNTVTRYLAQLRREATITVEELGRPQFARIAMGGGTPSFLDLDELEDLFQILTSVLGVPLGEVPFSFELSPATVDSEKLAFLRDNGVTRASIGIQSFQLEETRALGRPQQVAVAERALDLLRETGFPMINLDLIYGAQGQTRTSWLASLERAMIWSPEELYLYPLYVRPLTGLDKQTHIEADRRLCFYRAGRDFLTRHGYAQISMRHFRRLDVPEQAGPVYRCQEDGMVGLGAGARSYTQDLHYSSEYAVSRGGVREILDTYLNRNEAELRTVVHGFLLDGHERRLRFVIKSLLHGDGLNLNDYTRRFQSDFPRLDEPRKLGFCRLERGILKLTERGLEASDVIGPWLYSERVKALIAQVEQR